MNATHPNIICFYFKSLKSFSKNKILKNHKNFDNLRYYYFQIIKTLFLSDCIIIIIFFFFYIFRLNLIDNCVLESKQKWVYKEVS